MTIGERIKQLRTDKNLTQPQLAEAAGIEQSYLSKLENDKSIPSGEILTSLLKALEADIALFLKGIDDNIIQRHLVQIPEIAVYLNSESHVRIRQAKRWLLGSALSCAVGFALLFGGLKQLIFSPLQEVVHQYVSVGVILPSEPEDLFDHWEVSIQNRMYAGQVPSLELGKSIQMAKDEFRKRLNSDNQQGAQYKGRRYKVDVQGGYRIYEYAGERVIFNKTYERANNWLAVLGAFLAFGGLAGFFVEFRLRRL